jgi:hypothetical protein
MEGKMSYSKYDRQEYAKTDRGLNELKENVKENNIILKKAVRTKATEFRMDGKIHTTNKELAAARPYGHYDYCKRIQKQIKFVDSALFLMISASLVVTLVQSFVRMLFGYSVFLHMAFPVATLIMVSFNIARRSYWTNILGIIVTTTYFGSFVSIETLYDLVDVAGKSAIVVSILSAVPLFALQIYNTYRYRIIKDVAGFPTFSIFESRFTSKHRDNIVQGKYDKLPATVKPLENLDDLILPDDIDLSEDSNNLPENISTEDNQKSKNCVMPDLDFDILVPDEFNTK